MNLQDHCYYKAIIKLHDTGIQFRLNWALQCPHLLFQNNITPQIAKAILTIEKIGRSRIVKMAFLPQTLYIFCAILKKRGILFPVCRIFMKFFWEGHTSDAQELPQLYTQKLFLVVQSTICHLGCLGLNPSQPHTRKVS